MDTKSPLYQLMGLRMNGIMNEITAQDEHYQSLLKRADECTDRLDCSFKKIHLKLDMNDELLPPLTADEERIYQILEILIDNAINYSPPGSEIQLGANVKKNVFSFYVVDHGVGIKDEDKPFIYDRLYCADKSRTQRDHYGLGLSIARELAEMHGGSNGLSDTPGGGCTFRVSFPL